MERKKYIVFLDLDGTICKVNSGYALVRAAFSRNMVGAGGIINALRYSLLHKLHLAPDAHIINVMGGWIRGMKQETLNDISAEAAERYIFTAIFTEVYDEILFHRSSNAELALLSSAIDGICKPVAAYIGLDHYICTEMEAKDGVLTGSPQGSYCFGAEKRNRIITVCNERGFNPSDAFCYADSYSDVEALETVGIPVCVNPDSRLSKIAVEKGWQIRSWKNTGSKK